jgi:hypothetical protein
MYAIADRIGKVADLVPEDRIVRCVEEQGARELASAYPRSASCV